MAELKKDWVLNPAAFHRLLEWLDGGGDSEGVRYLEVRRRLTAYFDRKNCSSSDELADETLNRIARKLEEKGAISKVSPLHYCYIVAKFVFLEHIRRAEKGHASLDERLDSGHVVPGLAVSAVPDAELDATEKFLDCLERCLKDLPSADQKLILEYYRGEQRTKIDGRAKLAARLGLTLNALSIRACRLRQKLEECVKTCLGDL